MLFGVDRIKSFFPPLITGTMIIVIGLTLSPGVIAGNIVNYGVGAMWQKWVVVLVVLATMTAVSIFVKGFFKLTPILIGIVAGCIASAFLVLWILRLLLKHQSLLYQTLLFPSLVCRLFR